MEKIMTNIEKALELINDFTDETFSMDCKYTGQDVTLTSKVEEAVELASKLDCYYPSKGEFPKELEPVLAQIHHINDLGLSVWYEVVYFSEKWNAYNNSNTFKDGEKVKAWTYLPKFEEL